MESSRMMSVRGTNIRLLEGGAGDALIYLHGATGGGQWLPFLDRLAARFHVYAPEHPGFGASDDLPEMDSIEDLAYFYLDFLDTLGLDGARFIGSSLGGWLAVEIAAIAPHRVSQLILLDAAGLHVEGVNVPDLFMLDDEQVLELTIHNPESLAQRRQALIAADARQAEVMARNRATVANLAWNPYFHRPKLRHRLHRIQLPVLLIWGEFDRIFPPAIGAEYERLLPDAKLHIIPECGHLPAQERVDEVAERAMRFLLEGVR
ncbi:alpha/beta fold hydrolase [Alicyclobacillus kakegawensis]|uniref:alpha/beta fold hydrolase n=1 Tax=Alicyclobacillus kakegawensis TaxID=392012 RepID=UPI00082FF75B|nr:alpha/beta fold hydrolase [Alicyclobacillus kakegawensis]